MPWATNLPPELGERIFSYLRVTDRQNARLVCRNWYNATAKHSEDEWVIVAEERYAETNSVYKDSLKTLQEVFENVRKPSNLKFVRCQVGLGTAEKAFWRDFAPHVRQLTLSDCRVSSVTLVFILEQCTRLETLRIVRTTMTAPGLLSSSALEQISENVAHLKHFELSKYDFKNKMELKKWQAFLDCLQSLGSLSFLATTNINYPKEETLVHDQVPLLKGLLDSTTIATSSLHLRDSIHLSERSVNHLTRLRAFKDIIVHENLILSELSLGVSLIDDTLCRDLQSLTRHAKTLRSLKITVGDGYVQPGITAEIANRFGERIMESIMCLQNLSTFNFNCDMGRTNTPPVWQIMSLVWDAIFSPSLQVKTLHICNYRLRYIIPTAHTLYPLHMSELIGPHLRNIRLEQTPVAGHLLSPPSVTNLALLTSLELNGCATVTDHMLQKIYRDCSSLRRFQVIECIQVTDCGLTGEKPLTVEVAEQLGEAEKQGGMEPQQLERNCEKTFDITNLTLLEELTLDGNFGEKTALQLKFASLRVLSLKVREISEAATLSIARNNPQLESMSHFVGWEGPWQRISRRTGLGSDWGVLQRFISEASPRLSVLNGCVKISEKQMIELKQMRPSLRKFNNAYFRLLPVAGS